MRRLPKYPILIVLWFIHHGPVRSQWTKGKDPEIPVPIATFNVAIKGDTVFTGAYRGTIYRSTDAGSTWREIRSGLPPNFYSAFTLLINRNIIYAGTDGGVFRSTNWGDDWMLAAAGLPSSSGVHSLIGVENKLVAGTGFGVYESSDSGDTWQPDTSGLPKDYYGGELPVNSLVVVDSFLVAGVSDGVYRRYIGGGRWAASNSGIPLDVSHHPRVNSLLFSGGRLYAATDFCGASVYVSTDKGGSWTWASKGFLPNYSGCYLSVWSFGASESAIFAGTQYGMYRSTDAGNNWMIADSGLPLGPAGDLFVTSYSSSGARLFASTFSGVFRLNAGDSVWRPIFTTYPKMVVDLAMGGAGGNLFRMAHGNYWNGSIQYMYRSTDHGDIWSIDTTPRLASISSFQSAESNLYALGAGISVSTDFGDHWSKADSGLPYYGFRSISGENGILYAGRGLYILNGDEGGVYRSTNGGMSWDTAGLMGLSVATLAAHGQTVVAVTSGRWSGYGIHRTIDGGNTWTDIDFLFPAGVRVGFLVTVGSVILAGTNQGVYYSADSGATWVQSVVGWPRDSTGHLSGVSLLYVNSTIEALKGYCFAGVGGSVLATNDMATTWKTISDGLPGTAVGLLAADTQVLIAGTSEGIWRRAISHVTSAAHDQMPSAFSLAQNFPNPFNPATTISYDLPVSALVRLTVFDLLGRVVEVLEKGEKPRGHHELKFEAGGIASGVYYYRLEAGRYTSTKKLMVLR